LPRWVTFVPLRLALFRSRYAKGGANPTWAGDRLGLGRMTGELG
jgi:hypothetical protein